MAKGRNGNSTALAVGAVVLAAAIAVGGACAGWYAREQNWFGIAGGETAETDAPADTGGLVVAPAAENGISVAAAKLTAEMADEEGIEIPADAEGAYTVTAAVTPDYLTAEQKFDWTIAFNDPSSEWATGKTVTDYVTVTPAADGAATATVACAQAFGEPITVTCAVRGYELTATCSVDYAQKYLGTEFVFEQDGGEKLTFYPNDEKNIDFVDKQETPYTFYTNVLLSDVYTLAQTPVVEYHRNRLTNKPRPSGGYGYPIDGYISYDGDKYDVGYDVNSVSIPFTWDNRFFNGWFDDDEQVTVRFDLETLFSTVTSEHGPYIKVATSNPSEQFKIVESFDEFSKSDFRDLYSWYSGVALVFYARPIIHLTYGDDIEPGELFLFFDCAEFRTPEDVTVSDPDIIF